MNKLFKIIKAESVAFLITTLYQSIVSILTIYFNIKDMKILFVFFLVIAIISFIGLIIIWVNKVFDFRNKEIKSLQNDLNDLAIALNTIFKYRMLRSYNQDQVFSQFNVPEIVKGELIMERNLVTDELFKNTMKGKSIIEIDKILDKLYEYHRDNK